MTHDVKNLLQSLNALCAAAEQEADGSGELQALMRRQLPVITSRLQQALDKMRAPAAQASGAVQAMAWWRALQRGHYSTQNIEFREGALGERVVLPRELFDSAADNLLQNALTKRRLQGNLAISVSLDCGERVRLEVSDSGHTIPEETARELLRGPVPSASGLGIGLYQVARLAESSGYALTIEHNAEGKVSFVLSGPPGAPAEPPAVS
jgi:signal transduction histidine kinase